MLRHLVLKTPILEHAFCKTSSITLFWWYMVVWDCQQLDAEVEEDYLIVLSRLLLFSAVEAELFIIWR